MAVIAARGPISISRSSLRKLMQHKSTIAFLMTLPLILVLVAYARITWLCILRISFRSLVDNAGDEGSR